MSDKNPDSKPQKEGQTEIEKSMTLNKGERPIRKTAEPIKWSIRGVERETMLVIEKAASRTSKTLGEFFNDELREAATSVIKKGDQPPARSEYLVANLVEQLKAELQGN